jgi:uncharacterized protein (DUF58 family)
MDLARARRADLLDPATIAALGRIEVIARWVVDGFLTGLHRSPRKGFSVEFAEHRPYQPGDEPRLLDWKIAARSDRLVVKQFEEETNLRATIVLDVSRSMAWRGDRARLTKLAYAEQLAAAIALLFLRQRDAVGLIRFDAEVRTAIAPRARRGQWKRLIAALDDPGAGRETRAGAAFAQAGRLIPRRGLIVLLSDLLLEPEEVLVPVRALRRAGHQIVVMHVLDPAERDLVNGAGSGKGEAVFVDPESEYAVPAAVAEVSEAYRQTVVRAIGEWREQLARVGATYELVDTDAPFGVPLRKAFAARQRAP